MRKIGRNLLLLGVALGLAACGDVSPATQDARGIIGDAPPGIALAIAFIVITIALIVAAVALDRYVRSRHELTEASAEPEEEDEEEDEPVVAGIGQGTAAVPRWLYGFYIVIPIFAILYVLNAVAFEELVADDPVETPPPGIAATWEVYAENIQFDTDHVTLPANTEVTIEFDNRDSVLHDVVIFTDDTMEEVVFRTDLFAGPEVRTFTFTSPGAGEFFFHCSIHPSMNGWIEFVEPDEEAPEADETQIDLVAENIQFDTEEIVVPAGEELTLVFENRDGVLHDFVVFTDETMAEEVFATELFASDTQEYTFTIEEPGEYYFHCSVHPAMDGFLIAN